MPAIRPRTRRLAYLAILAAITGCSRSPGVVDIPSDDASRKAALSRRIDVQPGKASAARKPKPGPAALDRRP